jgi:two-component system, NtrC family, sensor kinase
MSSATDSAFSDPQAIIADLRCQLDACRAECDEAHAQQTAAAEVLQVINAGSGDLAPVFDAMLEKALRLCEASFGSLFTFDGAFNLVAQRNLPLELVQYARAGFRLEEGGSALAGLAAGEPLLHIADITETDDYRSGVPARRALADLGGARAALWVALRKEAALLGAFVLYRKTARVFSERQIGLVRTFADQAVIAIENARLLGELRQRTREFQEALDYQTATSDVLQVIGRSAFDLDAVLRTVVASAVQLCRGEYGVIFRNEGGEYRYAAGNGNRPEYEESERRAVIRPGRGTIIGRAALEGRAVQIADALSDPDYADKDAARSNNARTMLGVPLLREGQVIGAFGLARNRVETFSAREVELVTTFADQAAIAIESVRLLDALRARTRDLEEALEYQTATSDVLQVISRSTFDLQPVLETLTESALRLCQAATGGIAIKQDDNFRYVTSKSPAPEFDAFIRAQSFRPGRDSIVGRVALEGRVVQIADNTADPEYRIPEVFALAGIRTILGVPLLRDGETIGVVSLCRKTVEPFSERLIDLVRTFADQAVIAIENTRLLTELRESLEQQQALAEVLGVINANPGNLQPVFEAMLEKGMELCRAAAGGLGVWRGGRFEFAALRGVPQGYADFIVENGASPGSREGFARVARGSGYVQLADAGVSRFYEAGDPFVRGAVDLGGARTTLTVPLAKDDAVFGIFCLYRHEVHAFTERQIALIKSFAAQAVVAIDNARLLDEIHRRQAELRVTFDHMGDGVAMFGADTRLAAWNRNFETLLDLPEAFLATRPSFSDYFHYLTARGEYAAAPEREADIRRTIERGDAEMRFERNRPDGRVVEVRRNPVPGGGFVLMYSDITARKRAEAEIRAARDAAEQALLELRATQQQLVVQQKMAALGQLTAGIAHEIKNPLNFINNFAGLSNELLLELKAAAEPSWAALGDDARADIDEVIGLLSGNLDKIAEHGRRADNIVKSMLEHSRGVSGERRTVDLNALVDEALNLAYHGARAQDQRFNITLERDFAGSLAAIELVPQDMTRVLLNLFGNGFYAVNQRRQQAQRGFQPLLRVTTRDFGNAVEVRIRDNGTGIPPNIRDKLFQPFFTTKPSGEGTGLGLSISYDIVTQQHGGALTVDSEEGAFTEFTIRLPRVSSPQCPGALDMNPR